MKTSKQINTATTLAKTLAPEDVRCGDYVTILTKSAEFPSFFWDCRPQLNNDSEVINISFRPEEAGEPQRVVEICLPFVLTKTHKDKVNIIDIRASSLVKLSDTYAKKYYKLSKPKKNKQAKSSKKSS